MSTNVFSQDIIVLKTGDEIKAIVNEVDLDVIRFKKVENIKGPIYTLEKSKLFMIRYENGYKDIFSDTPEVKKETAVSVSLPRVETPKTTPIQSSGSSTSVTDIDGNTYKIVTIGTQVWMAENLKTTRYRNGDPIPNVSDGASWIKLTTGALCNCDNDANNSTSYGRLYNWHAVSDSRNIAPLGWHIPTDAEWSTLATYLGGEGIAGGKLKEAGTTHWQTPNSGANNETGFAALPAGYRDREGNWGGIGWGGFFWSSSERDAVSSWRRQIEKSSGILERSSDMKTGGNAIRCVKDL